MNIHVSNISFHTTEDELNAMFSVYGTVKAVKIIRGNHPGEKAFGFVEMNLLSSATEAINALDGKEIQGRRLKVVMAKDSFEYCSRKDYSRDNHPTNNPFRS